MEAPQNVKALQGEGLISIKVGYKPPTNLANQGDTVSSEIGNVTISIRSLERSCSGARGT